MTVCPMCGMMMLARNVNHHMAIKHLMDKYIQVISSHPGHNSQSVKDGRCPLCPWKAKSEEVEGRGEEEVTRSNQVLLVKHFSHAHCPVSDLPSHHPTPQQEAVPPATVSPPLTPSALPGESQDVKLLCKLCKRLVASKTRSDGKIRVFGSGGARCSCNPKQKKASFTCRVCGTIVDLNKDLKKHLESDEHKQKEKVFSLLTDVYYKARGIDESCGYDGTNYKFFILALKAFAVHNEGLTVMDCLSLLMNILEMSLTQYNELYRHVDRLAGEAVPEFLCFSCNYAEYGRISSLSRHTQSEAHTAAVSRLSREFLFCTQCGAFFSSENMMAHAEHLSDKLRERHQERESKKRKRQSSGQTQEEKDEEKLLDDILKSSDDEADNKGDNDKAVANRGEDSTKENTETIKRPAECDVGQGDLEENKVPSSDYYYFCLDCEEELSGQSWPH